jgi:aromatic ring-opening dioxygenase LigB subunit
MYLEILSKTLSDSIKKMPLSSLTEMQSECIQAAEPTADKRKQMISELVKYEVLHEIRRKENL